MRESKMSHTCGFGAQRSDRGKYTGLARLSPVWGLKGARSNPFEARAQTEFSNKFVHKVKENGQYALVIA